MAPCRRQTSNLFLQFQLSFVTFSLIALLVPSAAAWDNEDFELFDLVEEVQLNFYDVLGIERTASTAEVRKAYRKQSLVLHPDKNKEEGAEEKFRRLVAIAEVLKDTDIRQRYDHILEHGLPDWREPVFYYRRVRKMGLLELAVLLFIISTVGHYIVLWSIYWERLLELDSIIPKRKKDKKSKKLNRQPTTTDPEPTSPQDLPTTDNNPFSPVKPSLTDALPCKLYRMLLMAVVSAPSALKQVVLEVGMWRERRRQEAELEEDEWEGGEEEGGKEKVKRRRRVDPTVYEYAPSSGEPVTYTPQNTTQEDTSKTSHVKSGDWSQEEVTRLIRTMTKYPGGTSDRWEKIAEEISRPVDEVIKKSKQIRSGGFVVNVEAAAQGITGAVKHTVSSKTGKTFTDDIITTSLPDCPSVSGDNVQTENQRKHKTAKPSKMADRTLLISQKAADSENSKEAKRTADDVDGPMMEEGMGSWSQRQQKILEKALSVYAKGVAERWEKIAEAVPGKTKEQCIIRYKELVETIRKKKQLNVEQPIGS